MKEKKLQAPLVGNGKKPGFDFAVLSDRGRVRSENQDSWLADPDLGLLVVSDGMGGQAAGAFASRLVVENLPLVLKRRLGSGERVDAALIRDALAELSRLVLEQAESKISLRGMGATVVMALVRDDLAWIGHMGDSRAYLFRGGVLEPLTRDHSLVEILLEAEEITPEEALDHPARGRITRFVGMPGRPLPEAAELALEPGDRLLLCCDGLTDMLSEEDMAGLIAAAPDLTAACRSLVESANQAGGHDNVTVLLAAF